MRFAILPPFAFVALALGLSACATPAIDSSMPFHIATVTVESSVQGQDVAYLLSQTESETRRVAATYGQVGAPKTLKVQILNVSYAGSGAALLGVPSRVLARATIEDTASKNQEASFVLEAADVEGGRGNIGRIIQAVSADPRKDDALMAENFAKKVFFKIYARRP